MTLSTSPPASKEASPKSKGTRKPMSIDLSALPPLIQPSPPSNTLLITNLQDLSIFHPTNLITIRDLIHESAPLHSFSPLKSFRRIVASFYSIDDAIRIRQLLDGEPIMGDRVRIYFGEPTPIEPVDQHLHLPESGKLFFISPPPSPPFGWEMRNEGPPNKQVHAEDLASALAKLHARPGTSIPASSTSAITTDNVTEGDRGGKRTVSRERSGSSTVVYHPEDHGDSSLLPAVVVEDTTGSPGPISPVDQAEDAGTGTKIMAHTARPPVELMEQDDR